MDIRKNEKNRLSKENEQLVIYITNIENEIAKLKSISSSDYTLHQITKEESNLAKKRELLSQNITRQEQVNMGLLDNDMICNGIYDEWELCNQQDFESTDNLMYNIITNPDLKIPQVAPDGSYCPNQSNINDENVINKKVIYSLDILGRLVDSMYKGGIVIDLYNNGSVKKKINY